MSHLDPRIRALIDAARAADPTAADRARVRAALAARLAPAAALSSGAGASPQAPPAPLASTAAGVGAKLLAAGAVIGVTSFGAGLFLGRTDGPRADLARHGVATHAMVSAHVVERRMEGARVAAAPAAPEEKPPAEPLPPKPQAPAEPAAGAVVAIAAAPRRGPERPPTPRSAGALPAIPAADRPSSPGASSLIEETALLREAQMSLGAGDARTALARLDDLGARHPDGLLREERLAARIVALCAAGRADDAHREAARFLVEAPLSIHAARVRASCAPATKDLSRLPGE